MTGTRHLHVLKAPHVRHAFHTILAKSVHPQVLALDPAHHTAAHHCQLQPRQMRSLSQHTLVPGVPTLEYSYSMPCSRTCACICAMRLHVGPALVVLVLVCPVEITQSSRGHGEASPGPQQYIWGMIPLIFFLTLICLDGYPNPSLRVRVLAGRSRGTGKKPERYLATPRSSWRSACFMGLFG
ncbi:hypothetical protein BGY98DRAFT_944068 [Russula aff. rugulosa BPL654]|nr:hypothetical protein BGY98DRAFT_944068 [Russula aff. rugulosa BPL654]